ncbi:hypothetical protein K1719_026671 [Acacia pycnantha]|nr:hypothetical protein K1719_026671 [Acacia pycnantha]
MEHPVGGESSTSNSTDASKWKYDVFLSFAGKDTRLKFTSQLDEAFKRSGIKTFLDDVDLERGRDISQNLFQAIEDSLCAVVVISEKFANSKWCLDELQKILESRKTLHRQVFPIFYDVDPADVRKQTKNFGNALAEHEKIFGKNTTKVQNWRDALFKISNLSGWDTRGKNEADVIKNIVGEVWTYLSSKLPSYNDNLVGIDSRVADLMPFLEIGSDEVHFVGIWSMGGTGKTTLARVVFEKLSNIFEMCCFLANVRETLQREGRVSLQKRILSHLKAKDKEIPDDDDYEGMKMIRKLLYGKKVLIVLDDVDNHNQLKNLAESPDWFGEGSRIIITTRDSHVLTASRVKRIYEMKMMKEDESLQLFCNKAFHKDHSEENYSKLTKSVVKYAGGLPLALEVLGSFLCGRSEAEWIDALDRLKRIPNYNIIEVLRISYDGLNEEEKTIFLDIACFFKGWKKKKVTLILKGCDIHSKIGIKVLIEKSLLVETVACTLVMHDLLQDLGRYIVHQESPNVVGERSRLWEFDEIKEVLENNKGSKEIQAIVMPDKYYNIVNVHSEAFSKMSNIRLLILSSKNFMHSRVKSPRGLSTRLIPLEKLVHIEMPNSQIKQLWNGIQIMTKLKFINLRYSMNLVETPDFSEIPYLEYLCLSWCESLVRVHQSIGKLKALTMVDMESCKNLEILPRKLETNSLTMLKLGSCEKLVVLPEFEEGMKKLSYLDISRTAINRLPESLESLTSLRDLDLSYCKILNLDTLLKVTSLTNLCLRNCGLNEGLIPDDFGSLSSLVALDLSNNNFVNLSSGCFSSLFRLQFLSLDFCQRLKSLPRLPPRLIGLHATSCDSMEAPFSSDEQIWNLVASLDHERRGRTKYYVTSYEDYVDARPLVEAICAPLRDFFAIIPGVEIPSWFSKNYKFFSKDCVIKVSIPPDFRDSEWLGIVVCLPVMCWYSDFRIDWSTKASEDDDFIHKEWGHGTGFFSGCYYQCIMVLELNEETCWQHLRGHNNSLHIKFQIYGANVDWKDECGWRLIRKQEIRQAERCNLNDFNQVMTQPQLATPHKKSRKFIYGIGLRKGLVVSFYPGKFPKERRSIIPAGDTSQFIPSKEADIAILEEPEHLNWYHHALQAFFVKHINNWVTRTYCHKVLRLSAATQDLPKSEICNVHGVNLKFLTIGTIAAEREVGQKAFTKGAYFLGKMVWAKGYKELIDLLAKHKSNLDGFKLDVFGNGEDAHEVQSAARR